MYLIYMINKNFLFSNLLITGLFNSSDKSFIVKLLPSPNTFFDLIAEYAAKSYGVLTLNILTIYHQLCVLTF